MAISVVVYEDLQCRDCAQFRMMMDLYLIPRFEGRVAFIHRDFPLPKHDWAFPAAAAARYLDAAVPGLGERLRRELLARIPMISAAGFEGYLRGFAAANLADPDAAAAACHDSPWTALVRRDIEAGEAAGVVKTPTVFAGETAFVESFAVEDVIAAIETQLGAAQ